MKNLYFYKMPIGIIGIAEKNNSITNIYFGDYHIEDAIIKETPILDKAALELKEYFGGKRKAFDLSFEVLGTEFMQKVWYSLCDIPYAETRSYKDIAISVGNPNASRAVGRANNRNRIAIIIPCHRVIGSNNTLMGYGGGIEIKQYLLDLEKAYKNK
ncbi:MAG: methylated-DNA--[protein]-cysteine S-methyltransferase [Clostridia bacterium]|nr:methylated-DNA--[protein]-cysteine S-methyltransferase [Clostridia bacterium]